MRTFRERIEEAFFVITSENIAKIKQGRLWARFFYSFLNGTGCKRQKRRQNRKKSSLHQFKCRWKRNAKICTICVA